MNNGSGSLRKKDFSKLLITLRSLHFCNGKNKFSKKVEFYSTHTIVLGSEKDDNVSDLEMHADILPNYKNITLKIA